MKRSDTGAPDQNPARRRAPGGQQNGPSQHGLRHDHGSAVGIEAKFAC